MATFAAERSLRFVDGKSDKVWRASLSKRAWTAHWGRTGTVGQTKTYRFATAAAARADFEKKVGEKLAKGYVEVRGERTKPAKAVKGAKPAKRKTSSSELPAHDKQRAAIERLFARAKLPEEVRETLRAMIRPGISLVSRAPRASDRAVGATRLGGAPDLPTSFAWPKRTAFIAQIRLADVAAFDVDARLPHEGWLTVFADRYLDRVSVHWLAPTSKLEPRVAPPDADAKYDPKGLTITAQLHLPPPSSVFVGLDAPKSRPGSARRMGSRLSLPEDLFTRYWDDVWLAWTRVLRPAWTPRSPARHHMLGYFCGEDSQAPKEEVAVAIDSDARLGMVWGDEGVMSLLVDGPALAKGRIRGLRPAF